MHINRAGVVCFLGFGYHHVNLRRLAVPSMLRDEPYQHVFGTGHGLGAGESERVKRRLNLRIKLGGPDDDCLKVLRSFDVFRP